LNTISYRASRWTGLMSWTKLLMPDQIHIHNDRIVIKQYRFMGLNSTTEEIKYNKIASVRNASGLFFAALKIETSGGATSDILMKGLKKKQAQEAANTIREKAE